MDRWVLPSVGNNALLASGGPSRGQWGVSCKIPELPALTSPLGTLCPLHTPVCTTEPMPALFTQPLCEPMARLPWPGLCALDK